MSGADRAVRLIGVAIEPARRARFVEEWSADAAAARALGLAPSEIVLAAARVAAFLLWVRFRPALRRRRRRRELLATGVLLGLVLVVADVQVDVLVPFVVLAVAWWCWRTLRAWIDGAR